MIGHFPCLLPVAAQPDKEGVIRGEKLELLPRKAVWSSTGSLYEQAFFCSETFNPLKKPGV